MKILAIVLPFLVYFLGGMIAWDIYSASLPDDIGIIDYCHRQVLVYALIATAYTAIWTYAKLDCIFDTNKDDTYVNIIPFASFLVTQFVLPASTGADILNTIICLAAMIYIGYKLADK